MTTRTLTASRLALAAAASVVCLFANDNLSSTRLSSLITQADAEVGRPMAPGSVAGVARRADRRAVRRDVAVGGAAVGTGAYYGAGGYGTVGMERRAARREVRRDVVGGAAVGTGAYYGVGGYGTVGMARRADRRAARRDAVVGGTAFGGGGAFGAFASANYGPGPVENSVIVNPNTGRWCRFEANGWRWCWTP